MINKKEPTVKKSVRLPMGCAAIIDDICEENGMSFTEALVRILKIGIDELNKFEVPEEVKDC